MAVTNMSSSRISYWKRNKAITLAPGKRESFSQQQGHIQFEVEDNTTHLGSAEYLGYGSIKDSLFPRMCRKLWKEQIEQSRTLSIMMQNVRITRASKEEFCAAKFTLKTCMLPILSYSSEQQKTDYEVSQHAAPLYWQCLLPTFNING